MRDYEQAIASDIFTVSRAASEGEIFVGGGTTWDLANGGVRLAPFAEAIASTLPVELTTRLQEATDGILSGTVETCADPCGVSDAPDEAPLEGAEGAEGAAEASASPAPDDASA
jgi:hypothetical protein